MQRRHTPLPECVGHYAQKYLLQYVAVICVMRVCCQLAMHMRVSPAVHVSIRDILLAFTRQLILSTARPSMHNTQQCPWVLKTTETNKGRPSPQAGQQGDDRILAGAVQPFQHPLDDSRVHGCRQLHTVGGIFSQNQNPRQRCPAVPHLP